MRGGGAARPSPDLCPRAGRGSGPAGGSARDIHRLQTCPGLGCAPNKAENGRYVSKYVASFVGLVPARKPRLAILVMVDEPHGQIWGGVVAAPIFRDLARFALQYLEVPPDAPETKRSSSLLAAALP